jgi:hypothetical protein
MRVYKSVEIKVEKVEKVVCNMCGKTVEVDEYGNIKDYIHIEKKWGYSSDMDGDEDSIDLCQQCYKAFISKFKINIKGLENN